mmetsp:Transcript_800/g.1429  ORF Transcript_800/g.1429 Transcript_800/m.1429 type:complete len:231 (-) Transcript_800:2091-2783(-)
MTLLSPPSSSATCWRTQDGTPPTPPTRPRSVRAGWRCCSTSRPSSLISLVSPWPALVFSTRVPPPPRLCRCPLPSRERRERRTSSLSPRMSTLRPFLSSRPALVPLALSLSMVPTLRLTSRTELTAELLSSTPTRTEALSPPERLTSPSLTAFTNPAVCLLLPLISWLFPRSSPPLPSALTLLSGPLSALESPWDSEAPTLASSPLPIRTQGRCPAASLALPLTLRGSPA